MTGYSFSTPVWDGGQWTVPEVAGVTAAARIVNGPEDQPRNAPGQWDRIDWRAQEEQVRRLRQRIFTAAQEQDWPKVRNLQKLMLRSRANTLVSVRQVTQRNTGRRTAGIDGEVALTSEARARVAVRVHQSITSWRPRAVRRVYVPKASNRAKLRPLGIPVLMDRCHQQRVRHALEPEWEARFEPRSYGFRPGRGCQDAIAAICNVCAGPLAQRVWALDADLAAAFDRIDHDHLLASLGSFPARDLIRGWLKAGVFEAGKGFAPTVEGTPQGGVISPCLLNVALHGLEEAAGVRHKTSGIHAGETVTGSPVAVRYADDVVVLCHSQEQAGQVKARLAGWLAPRGLAFNEDKTKIVHLGEGFDFLGFNVRRYHRKLLIKPSKAAVKRLRERLAAQTRRLRGLNAVAVITALSPVIRGSGRPTTGRWCHQRSSARWTAMHGSCSISGQDGVTGTSRGTGSSPGTSASSISSGTTTGYSETAIAAATWSSSPGPASNGTCRSRARHPPMTPPWPATGPGGARRRNPRWTGTPCACCPGRPDCARSAETACCPPSSHPSLLSNGSGGGCTSPAGR
jgi:RNA-directed DNA polymerase